MWYNHTGISYVQYNLSESGLCTVYNNIPQALRKFVDGNIFLAGIGSAVL